ncbi:DUF2508 family protein [Clostridium sp. 1001271B_151109_B4]|uniref:DUF2508 family protein n=1 Tax=Clostridium sp. 1001271B_151109_B4 TaxID=2787148 RepID=UPI0018AAB854|nr:DUF2508 family protein [Clostridium sp. 1001271B_151109_B4]
MNIKNILNFILVHYKDNDTIDNKILNEMHEAIIELEVAEAMFNSVNDPKLIEAAIYREEAAKKKVDYILSVAKEQYSNMKKEAEVEVKEEMEI